VWSITLKHDIHIKGFAFRLRPIALSDAKFIVELRNDSTLTKYLHPISPLVKDQEAYLENYFTREGDYYFVIERMNPEGLIALYNIDKNAKKAEFGRWVLRRGSQAAVESALLLYQVAFNHLNLERVYCHTIKENHKVVSFHNSCGLTTERILRQHVTLNNIYYDVVEQRLIRERWPDVEANLSSKAAILSRIIDR
jgi:RimJ/RimL family protein N-acetyltransferase